MKKYYLLTLAFFFTSKFAQASFNDVTNQTDYWPAIDWVQQEGIMQGYGDGSGNFGPDNCLTRAELTKVVQEVRFNDFAERSKLLRQPKLFPDVKNGEWFFDYVNYARHLEIIDGYPEGDFRPNKCTSRVEAIKIIVNSLLPGEAQESNEVHITFHDGEFVFNDIWANEWYGSQFIFLLEHDLIGLNHVTDAPELDPNGVKALSFHPAEEMSRKEVANILYLINQFQAIQDESGYEIKDLSDHRLLSPNGKYIIEVTSGYDEGRRGINIINLERGSTVPAVEIWNDDIKPNERLKMTNAEDQEDYHIEWIDNDKIKFAVFNHSDDELVNKFIEYRTFSLDGYQVGYYVSPITQKELPYYYRKPAYGNNDFTGHDGIIVYMHGAGGGVEQGMSNTNYNGNFKNLKDFARDIGSYYVTAETSSFGEDGGKELAALLGHLDGKFGDLPIFIIGASAGGQTVYHALGKVEPYLHIDGAVFIVPTLTEDMINNINFVPTAESDIDFWIEGGEFDGALPPSRAELFKQKLEELGHDIMLNIIPGGDHNAPVEQIDWPTVIEFVTKPG